jgi:hypothetical protein
VVVEEGANMTTNILTDDHYSGKCEVLRNSAADASEGALPNWPCSLEECGKVFGYGWKFSASTTNLRKVKGYPGGNELDHDEFFGGLKQGVHTKERWRSLPSLDHRISAVVG